MAGSIRKRVATRTIWKLLLGLGVPLILLFLPLDRYPLEGLTLVERRTIAIFALAALFWVLEPIPIYATSVLIIVLELIMISDSALLPFRDDSEEALGTLVSHARIMGAFASPIIMLFIGGFFLAMAATKFRLDLNLARVLLRPFGDKPALVMAGLMGVTAVFSMFMSNTATTAMMLSILLPILQLLDPGDRGRTALALCIPVAANIGGIGTPIGTPPNAIALKYLEGAYAISFSEWMAFGLPYVLLLLVLGWALLLRLFPFDSQRLHLEVKGRFMRNRKAMVVYITFTVTILLWLTDFLHGMNAYVVAMIPVAVFLASGVINKEELKKLNWDVLWLVAGGIALGIALDRSGLAVHLVESVPFESYSPYVILGVVGVLSALMANFMSNTATANLLLPIMAALGASLSSLEAIGGMPALLVGVALASSMGMALPISTPPNALAHATGEIQTAFMARVGVILGVSGLILVFGLLFILRWVSFF